MPQLIAAGSTISVMTELISRRRIGSFSDTKVLVIFHTPFPWRTFHE
jgi:hypothetical protein